MFLKNIKDHKDELINALTIHQSTEENKKALEQEVMVILQTYDLMVPDLDTYRDAADQMLSKLSERKSLNQFHSIRPRTFGFTLPDKLENFEDYKNYQINSAIQSLLSNQHFRDALDALMNSKELRKSIQSQRDQIKSETLKKYVASLTKKGVFEMVNDELMSVDYQKFITEFKNNWKQLSEVSSKQQAHKIHWELIAKQVFLEAFLMSENNDKLLALTQITLAHLRYELKKLKLEPEELENNEQKLLLEDIALWHKFSGRKYAFFSEAERKVLNDDRIWAKEIVQRLESIAGPWNDHKLVQKVRRHLTHIEAAFESKQVQNIALVSDYVHEIYNTITSVDFPVKLETEHPSLQMVMDMMKGSSVDLEQIHQRLFRSLLLEVFRPSSARNDEAELFYMLTGFFSLKESFLNLKNSLTANQPLMDKVKAMSGRKLLTDKEKELISEYENAVKDLDEIVKIIEAEKSFFQNFNQFDPKIFSIMMRFSKLIQKAFSLTKLMIPDLTPEDLFNLAGDPQKMSTINKERLKHSQNIFLDHYNEYIKTIHRSLRMMKQIMTKDFESKGGEVDPLSVTKHQADISKIENYIKILSAQKLNISYVELSALNHFTDQMLILNARPDFEGYIDFDLSFYHEFKEALKKIFNINDVKLEVYFPNQTKANFTRLKDLLASEGSSAKDFEEFLRVKQNSNAIAETVRLNPELKIIYNALLKGIARVAVYFAENLGSSREGSFHIHMNKKGQGQGEIVYSINGGSNITADKLNWLNLALMDVSEAVTSRERPVYLELPKINNQILLANIEKLLMPEDKVAAIYHFSQKGQALFYADDGNMFEEVFKHAKKPFEHEVSDSADLIKQTHNIFQELKASFDAYLMKRSKLKSFTGKGAGSINLRSNSEAAKTQATPKITVHHPEPQVLAKPKIKEMIPEKNEKFEGVSTLNYAQLINAFKEVNQVRLEIDIPTHQFVYDDVMESLPITQFQDARGVEVIRNLLKKNYLKYSFSKDYTELYVRLNESELNDPESKLSDLIAALKDSENYSAVEKLLNAKNIHNLKQRMKMPYVAIQIISQDKKAEHGRVAEIRANSNVFNVIRFMLPKNHERSLRVLITPSDKGKDIFLITAEDSRYEIMLKHSGDPEVNKGGQTLQIDSKKPLEVELEIRKN